MMMEWKGLVMNDNVKHSLLTQPHFIQAQLIHYQMSESHSFKLKFTVLT